MATSSKLFPAVLLLLLVASEMGALPVVLAKVCQFKCKKCAGACFDDDECSITCRNEGFNSGDCHSPDHSCTCYKDC
ncbi:hypothetical protein ACP70R_019046 [Stipagrostis hirtigluma subsp. patula]